MWATSKVGSWLAMGGRQGGGKAEGLVELVSCGKHWLAPNYTICSSRTLGCLGSASARSTQKTVMWPLLWPPSAAIIALVAWSSTKWHSCSGTTVTAWGPRP